MTDRLSLGMACGAVAQVVKFAIGFAIHSILHWPRFGDPNVAAAIFLSREMALSNIGIAYGFVITEVIAAVLGVFLVYVLTYTGADKWRVKGPGVGLLAYLVFWGILSNLGITKVVPVDLGSNLYTLITYPLWGYLAAAFAVRWGDKSLFRGVANLQ